MTPDRAADRVAAFVGAVDLAPIRLIWLYGRNVMPATVEPAELRRQSRRFAQAAENEKGAHVKHLFACRAVALAEQADRVERDRERKHERAVE
jgi:hypothetical protein